MSQRWVEEALDMHDCLYTGPDAKRRDVDGRAQRATVRPSLPADGAGQRTARIYTVQPSGTRRNRVPRETPLPLAKPAERRRGRLTRAVRDTSAGRGKPGDLAAEPYVLVV